MTSTQNLTQGPDDDDQPTSALSTSDEPRTPARDRSRFHCPFCQTFASQTYGELYFRRQNSPGFDNMGSSPEPASWTTTKCSACERHTLWLGEDMIWPTTGSAPPAHSEMPENVRELYLEAARISTASPRSGAALLRLALEKLVKELEPGPGSLNDKIGDLHKRGLPEPAIQAMDVLRVTGNEAVHSGTIRIEDGGDDIAGLFSMLNLIVSTVIAPAKSVAQLFALLPEGARKAIEQRNNK